MYIEALCLYFLYPGRIPNLIEAWENHLDKEDVKAP